MMYWRWRRPQVRRFFAAPRSPTTGSLNAMPAEGAVMVGYDGTEGAHAALAEALRARRPARGGRSCSCSRAGSTPSAARRRPRAAARRERGLAMRRRGRRERAAAGITARGEARDGRAADGWPPWRAPPARR